MDYIPFAHDEDSTFEERIGIPGYDYWLHEMTDILYKLRQMGFNPRLEPAIKRMSFREMDILVHRIQ